LPTIWGDVQGEGGRLSVSGKKVRNGGKSACGGSAKTIGGAVRPAEKRRKRDGKREAKWPIAFKGGNEKKIKERLVKPKLGSGGVQGTKNTKKRGLFNEKNYPKVESKEKKRKRGGGAEINITERKEGLGVLVGKKSGYNLWETSGGPREITEKKHEKTRNGGKEEKYTCNGKVRRGGGKKKGGYRKKSGGRKEYGNHAEKKAGTTSTMRKKGEKKKKQMFSVEEAKRVKSEKRQAGEEGDRVGEGGPREIDRNRGEGGPNGFIRVSVLQKAGRNEYNQEWNRYQGGWWVYRTGKEGAIKRKRVERVKGERKRRTALADWTIEDGVGGLSQTKRGATGQAR